MRHHNPKITAGVLTDSGATFKVREAEMQIVFLGRLLPHEQPFPKLARTQAALALKWVAVLVRHCFRNDWEERGKMLILLNDLEEMNSRDALAVIGELKPESKLFLKRALSIFGIKLGQFES